MKLSLANLNTVKLQSFKLQSFKPFKKIARKLSLLESERAERARNLARVKKEKSAYRMALTLLLVRPWVLVMGFWIFSLGIGSLALGGMLSPRRLTMALPEPAVDASVVSSAQSTDTQSASTQSTDTSQFADASTTEAGADADSAESTSAGTTSSSSLTLALPLFLLVSACAVGCFMISRQRTMKMAAARARVRKVRGELTLTSKASSDSQLRSKPKAPARKPSKTSSVPRKLPKKSALARPAPKHPVPQGIDLKIFPKKAGSVSNRLASSLNAELQPKKRRHRSKTAIAARMAANRITSKPVANGSAANGGKGLVSRAAVAHAGVQARQPTRSRKSTIRAANRRRRPASQPTVVSVMPAGESHALDWHEGSLAHRMDVRPHRSAM
ncbi:MAG: hypothetical protein AAF716_05425 [Cyanobacteria bacterium P01_D01_bin.1]